MGAAMQTRWLILLMLLAGGLAHAQGSGRLIDEVGVSEQGGDVAVTVLFGCRLRYVSHTATCCGCGSCRRPTAAPRWRRGPCRPRSTTAA